MVGLVLKPELSFEESRNLSRTKWSLEKAKVSLFPYLAIASSQIFTETYFKVQAPKILQSGEGAKTLTHQKTINSAWH